MALRVLVGHNNVAIIQYQIRPNLAADWTGNNVVLAQGEPGFEADTKKLKIGDGTTAWNSLGYTSLGSQGSNTQVLFNDSNLANGSAGFVFNRTSNNLLVSNTVNATSYTIGSFFDAEPTFVFYSGNVNTSIMSVGVASPTAYMHIKAGTASVSTAPLKLEDGVNLTTPEAGTIEHDVIYFATPSTSFGRSAIPLTHYISGSGVTTTSTTSASLFPATQDIITLPVGTYFVTMGIRITNSGTTSGTLRIDMQGNSGTAAGNFSWRGYSTTTDSGTAANTFAVAATTLGSNITVTGTSAAAARQYVVYGYGILRITTAGPLQPSYNFSASVGGTTTLNSENYMIIQQLSSVSAAFGPTGSGWG